MNLRKISENYLSESIEIECSQYNFSSFSTRLIQNLKLNSWSTMRPKLEKVMGVGGLYGLQLGHKIGRCQVLGLS